MGSLLFTQKNDFLFQFSHDWPEIERRWELLVLPTGSRWRVSLGLFSRPRHFLKAAKWAGGKQRN